MNIVLAEYTHYYGGIGRRAGLKILLSVMTVWVRFPLVVPTNPSTEDGLAPLKDTLALGSNYPNELHDPK